MLGVVVRAVVRANAHHTGQRVQDALTRRITGCIPENIVDPTVDVTASSELVCAADYVVESGLAVDVAANAHHTGGGKDTLPGLGVATCPVDLDDLASDG